MISVFHNLFQEAYGHWSCCMSSAWLKSASRYCGKGKSSLFNDHRHYLPEPCTNLQAYKPPSTPCKRCKACNPTLTILTTLTPGAKQSSNPQIPHPVSIKPDHQ
jgi:hypothetical protein